ncbi:hypothetical protein SK128_015285, partial [Halocaridina rubra]
MDDSGTEMMDVDPPIVKNTDMESDSTEAAQKEIKDSNTGMAEVHGEKSSTLEVNMDGAEKGTDGGDSSENITFENNEIDRLAASPFPAENLEKDDLSLTQESECLEENHMGDKGSDVPTSDSSDFVGNVSKENNSNSVGNDSIGKSIDSAEEIKVVESNDKDTATEKDNDTNLSECTDEETEHQDDNTSEKTSIVPEDESDASKKDEVPMDTSTAEEGGHNDIDDNDPKEICEKDKAVVSDNSKLDEEAMDTLTSEEGGSNGKDGDVPEETSEKDKAVSDDSERDKTFTTDNSEKVKTKGAEEDDIMEIPFEKKMTEVVDLADEEAELSGKREDDEGEDDGTESSTKGLKLRSLSSLVDASSSPSSSVNRDLSIINTPGAVLSNPEAFGAVGEIVEHKDIFGDSSEGLALRISNVVGGEDCITGLAMDDDRDMLSSIQISSITTLMDPISPEDPNKETDEEKSEAEKPENEEVTEDSGIKIVSAESLASKDEDPAKCQEEASPKIRLSCAVSEVAKDLGEEETSGTIYHILRSILTMQRECASCLKKTVCEFRITKKGEPGTFAFLCSAECRGKWTTSLPANECVEKPRIIFEKLCGMCNKDLTTQSRSGQFSWETREFCSEDCLTSHLEEVAGRCHMCFEPVRPLYIGKYCVRFGSDIHQFCSNNCLERYKSKIKVCCYCQKNVENVTKVTSPANKEYCSVKCLKRAQRRDIAQQNYNEQHPCTVCQTKGLNRYEFLMNGEAQQLCSDPCLNVFKYVNKVKAVTCCLCYRVMNAEDVCQYLYHGGHQLRVFCSDSCVNVFILSARRIVNCDFCKVKKYNFDMIHRQVDEDFLEYYYCSLQCTRNRHDASGKTSSAAGTAATESTNDSSGNISAPSSTDAPMTVCSMCNTTAKAQFHMVMSDNTLRSFCQYDCASRYKSTFGYLVEDSQSKETSQAKSPAPPTIRPKPTSQLTAKSTNNGPQSLNKSSGSTVSPENIQATTEILKMLLPPTMENKKTMCKPAMCTKGVYCRPHPWHRSTQT